MYIKKKPKKEDSRQVCIILALTLVSERNSTWKVNTSYNIANLKKKEDIYLFIYLFILNIFYSQLNEWDWATGYAYTSSLLFTCTRHTFSKKVYNNYNINNIR
jgi:hypothetical protein